MEIVDLNRLSNCAISVVGSDASIADGGIQIEISTNFDAILRFERPGNLAVLVIQITEDHGIAAGFYTGWYSICINTVYAQRAGFNRSLAAWRPRFLIVQILVDETARLVGAGHHAVTTSDADVLVNQYDTVGAAEGGAGRTYVHTRGGFAMLAQHR